MKAVRDAMSRTLEVWKDLPGDFEGVLPFSRSKQSGGMKFRLFAFTFSSSFHNLNHILEKYESFSCCGSVYPDIKDHIRKILYHPKALFC